MSNIKVIKFDLPINGIKVKTLDELRDNLSDELVTLARSGQLERWLGSRKLTEVAQAVAAAVEAEPDDKALFLALCQVLEVEVHPDDVAALFDEPPQAGRGFEVKDIYLEAIYEKLQNFSQADFDEILILINAIEERRVRDELLRNCQLMEVKLPDIGDFDEVAVIELLVRPGDIVQIEQSIITVESAKASMEIVAPFAGVVRELKVKLGDVISTGSLLLLLQKI